MNDRKNPSGIFPLKEMLLLFSLLLGSCLAAQAQAVDSIPTKMSEDTVQRGDVETRKADIPFGQISTAPEFPNSPHFNDQEEAQQYFSQRMRKFVSEHFDTGNVLPYLDSTTTRIHIIITFTIDKNGDIKNINAHCQNPAAKAESVRVIKLLPELKPAKLNGQNVSMSYRLPIKFQIN